MKQEKTYTIQDTTENYFCGRIATLSEFKTIWGEDLKLLEYYYGWNRGPLSLQPLYPLPIQAKFAITRHKKKLMKQLGLTKEPTKVKIIYISPYPTRFYTDFAVEKKKTFQNQGCRYEKERCVIWTKEKAELVKQYQEIDSKRDKELGIILAKIKEV